MRQYIKMEAKRFFYTLPGFFLALFTTALFVIVVVFLAKNILPEVLEVRPFQVGLCVEGEDFTAAYIREYIGQMESTEGLVNFREIPFEEIQNIQVTPPEMQEISDQKVQMILEREELTACIIIPERTAESIMDGTNIPVRVVMGAGTENTERYLQKRLLTLLTECGAALIDVPQAETLLLYEMQMESPEEIGRILDLFHFGLVLEREDWFDRETISAFGSIDIKEYYLAAGLTLLLLFWGLGSGSFFREQGKNLPLLLERQGLPLIYQQSVKQILFFMLYLIPVVLFLVQSKSIKAAIPLLLCGMMLSLQCGFFFELAPTAASGVVLNSIWGFAGFLGAGGVLPSVFLPKFLTGICDRLPAGICMELLLQNAAGKRGAGGNVVWRCLLWCLIFGISGQLVFYGKQRSKV
ncbi:MAG: hypothetical protein HDQ96_03750 [Lachnospiraceae bacterium]|nr:hypothetical protein [Lachnospiraceae bacterium]